MHKFVKCIVHCPSVVFVLSLVLPVYLTYLVILDGTFEMDTSFESFKVDHDMENMALRCMNYLKENSGLDDGMLNRRLNSQVMQQQHRLMTIAAFFVTEEKHKNVLSVKNVQRISRTDSRIRNLPSYHRICSRNDNKTCESSISILPYVYTTEDEIGFPEFHFEHREKVILTKQKLQTGLEYVVAEPGGYKFFDKNFNLSSKHSTATVILYPIGCPLEGFTSCTDLVQKKKQFEIVADFVLHDMQPILQNTYPGQLDCYYGARELVEQIVKSTLISDLYLAIGTFVFLYLFICFHLNSVFLATMGMFHMILCFPATYYVYHVLLGIPKMGLMNFLSVFVIMGIGADDIFVVSDAWKLSKTHPQIDVDVPHNDEETQVLMLQYRMNFVFSKAATSTFVTSFTTAAAFASNYVAAIAPIREFGIFMSILVSWNYILCINYFVCVLAMHSKFIRTYKCITRCIRNVLCIKCRPHNALQSINAHDTSPKNTPRNILNPIRLPEINIQLPVVLQESPDRPVSRKERLSHFFREPYSKFILKFRLVILVAFAAIGAFCVYHALQLQQADGKPSFLSKRHPMEKSYHAWKNVLRNADDEFSNARLTHYRPGQIQQVEFRSKSLHTDRNMTIYLPSVYQDHGSSFPVVYLLHDFSGTHTTYNKLFSAYEMALSKNLLFNQVIFVVPDGRFRFINGSFFVNSKYLGHFEDYVVQDVVEYMDNHYNTIADNKHRFLLGHGSGGYAAIRMAYSNPKVFTAVAAHSPATNFNWSNTFLHESFQHSMENETTMVDGKYKWDPENGPYSYIFHIVAATFTPNIKNPPYYVDLPIDERGEIQHSINNIWAENNLISIIDKQKKDQTSSVNLFFDVGGQDEFGYYDQVRDLSLRLRRMNVSHVFESYMGGHINRIAPRLIRSLLYLTSSLPNAAKSLSANQEVRSPCPYCQNGFCYAPSECVKCSAGNICTAPDMQNERSCGIPNFENPYLEMHQVDACRTTFTNATCNIKYECQCHENFYGKFCEHASSADDPQLPKWALITVHLIIGIKPSTLVKFDDTEPIVDVSNIYDSEFSFARPETQLQLNKICETMASSKLVAGMEACIGSEFKKYVQRQNLDFPLFFNVSNVMIDFIHANPYFENKIGFSHDEISDEIKVSWLRIVVKGNVDDGGSAEYLNKEHRKWTSFVASLLDMPEYPKLHGFQACQTWILLQLELSASKGILISVLLSLAIATGSVAAFTKNFRLTILTMFVICCVIVNVLAFFVLTDWQLGSIEAISLSVIVGLSVDYCLHIVHAYTGSFGKTREARTKEALSTVGGSILGGAISTAGACSFLLGCEIQVLLLFGMIILATTVVSVVYSLMLLPILLSLFGPERAKVLVSRGRNTTPASVKSAQMA